MQKYKIIIAGAGLGGLTAACVLMQAGHDVEIYEQAPALGEIGAGIQVSANPMHVLRHIGVGEKITSIGVSPGAYVFRLHDTGEVIQRFSLSKEHEAMHGAPYTQLHRADLHEILAARARELKPDVVHLNKRVKSFTETADGVELYFDDGTSTKGDLLIGADGLKSVVRAQLFGAAPAVYTGDAAWRILVPVEKLPKDFLEPVMSVFMGPNGHAVCYYLRSGTLMNFVGIVETDDISEESWTVRYPWDNLKADFAGWHEAIQTIIDTADKDQCFRWSLFGRPATMNWSSKRVTLLGDSVHPTLPYLAQGAAMAIEDGAVLMRALAQEPELPKALQVYQRNRAERTAKIVTQSTDNRRLFHLPSQDAIRAEFSKRDEGNDRNRWLYSYNPLTVPLV
ncbi:FAD-dependent monooxygenase [Methylocella sp. CPCC 101449]|uniref:FAD-dependent monooxygenase n=1 Tax=Methylocella sp. CPCC 101449 TaxID=2987531 RepID=UPI002891DD56|nr:FAD-dependent monooxygenase [Methylocella sp. CPCC 101449]MDT2023947.1 FAD-dependent monooxygenase [Methylocella sp. CPCC 101449]HEV2573511.1 FAD-dependent monooxygenase [Beijerinckiaceae bacterium]